MFLLDTHTFLWYVSANPNLPQEIKDGIIPQYDVSTLTFE